MWVVYGFFIGLFVLMALGGLALAFLLPNEPGMGFASKFIFVFCAVLAIIFYVSAKKKMDKPQYFLYENGIDRKYKSQEYFMPAKDLTDLFLFTTGKSPGPNNLAFKSEGSDQWELISVHHSGNIGALIELNSIKRSEYLWPEIEQGKTIKFNYITTATALKNSFTALSANTFLNSKTQQVSLNNKFLTVNDTNYPLTDLQPIQRATVKGYLIKDKNGKEVFSFSETTLWSFAVFAEIYSRLLEQRS
ncbi:hypothetical protein [Chitinophaga vietnamensis]|uniref:hypothetical protein n=1 Tax=Chitinophaga vietnamensis TaxID=2593957 RepID=UPI001177BC51|nr:hypothetical protein [Chitinophaga vietnamensis]